MHKLYIFKHFKLFIDQYLSYLLFLLKFQNIVQLKTPNIHLCFLNLLDLIFLDAFISKIGGLVPRGFSFCFFLILSSINILVFTFRLIVILKPQPPQLCLL
jgi:hypothetical protein